jgi:hypothetical protein
VTLKVRVDYLEKNYDKQITALWEQINKLVDERSGGE